MIATGEKSEFGEIFKMMQCEEVGIRLSATLKHRLWHNKTQKVLLEDDTLQQKAKNFSDIF